MKQVLSAVAMTLMASTSLSLMSTQALAQTQPAQTAKAVFELPKLPFAADALSPVIGPQTVEIHYGKHHKAYVDTLNSAVAATPALQGMSLEAIVAIAGTQTPTVRNNAGGHWNHSFFWESLTAPANSGAPSPELAKAIEAQFGSMDAFKAEFKKAGTGRFGSGWVWLVVKGDGTLAITSTPNQDNPLMDVAEVKGTPLLGNDVWEHAYYLDYQNRRADYLDAYWAVVNWKVVSDRFAKAAR